MHVAAVEGGNEGFELEGPQKEEPGRRGRDGHRKRLEKARWCGRVAGWRREGEVAAPPPRTNPSWC